MSKATPLISAYFPSPKKGGSKSGPIDLTDDEPPRKKPRLASAEPSKQLKAKSKVAPRARRKTKPVEAEELSGDESDPVFKALTDKFKAKSKPAPAARTTTKPKDVEEVGPSGETYTPLEKQVLQFKKDYKDTVLMIRVGYKYKFFGNDAKVAEKELGMYPYMDRNFLVASIPDHRRNIHLKNLLSRAYKVGIVEQTETAALKKAGENRNSVFDRKLDKLYTAATYVDALDSADDADKYVAPPFMCVVETPKTSQQGRIVIGIISVSPSTGDIIWDDFEDDAMRLELETRFSYSKPAELLVCKKNLTKQTEKMLNHYVNISKDTRIEYFDSVMTFTDAFSFISSFYEKRSSSKGTGQTAKLMAEVSGLPKQVVIALAHTMSHLASFGLSEVFCDARFFVKFSTQTHMLLGANTLSNLEIYENQTDFSSKGSLISILDRTKTKFGARMLKTWVGRPLTNKLALQERIDAVEEILESGSDKLAALRQVLKGLPDLAKGLSRIQFGQCTTKELSTILAAFKRVGDTFESVETVADVGFQSALLNEVGFSLQHAKGVVDEVLNITTIRRLSTNEKHEIWLDEDRYPILQDHIFSLLQLESELDDELRAVRKTLRYPSLKWSIVAGDEFLIEVKKADNRPIPDNWLLVSRTRTLERYQTPTVRQKIEERSQRQESLQAEATKAFKEFLHEVHDKHYGVLRNVVNKLAIADCLLSLAHVALQPGYVKPIISDENHLEIVDGRHPIVEALSSDPFVPSSVSMGGSEAKVKIITGPNMGGKSSSVRMVALIAIMAQIGSYVPATSVKLGLLDAVLTRMGASDDLLRGRSTFQVEMAETSEILHTATDNSLVILDELGRGTSTFDGMAIAHAVLQFLSETRHCKTLFITHYPSIALDLEKRFPKDVQNLHMSYAVDTRITGSREITFLYRLTEGLASESYGVECGRLAGLPENLLVTASELSSQMREEVLERLRRNRARITARTIVKLRDKPRELLKYLSGL